MKPYPPYRWQKKLKRAICPLLLLVPLLFTSCAKEASTAEQQHSEVTKKLPAGNEPVTVRPLQFPRDEGAHFDQPIEWWYLNSDLVDAAGKEYTFFFCVLSTGRHLVSLFDKTAGEVHTKDYYESVNTTENQLSISSPSLKWKQTEAPFQYKFAYDFEGMTVELKLKSNKKPFLPGGAGLIAMGETGYSFYYALTDLNVTGSLSTGRDTIAVSGNGWIDHQWGKWNWTEDFSQWKWYGVNLDNGVDLMLFNIYKDKKLLRSYCGYIDRENRQYHNLPCELVTKKYYTDPSGGKWQKEVELHIPSLPGTRLTLTSERDQQFIESEVLWEGSMKASGTFNGVAVKGRAYGELNRPD